MPESRWTGCNEWIELRRVESRRDEDSERSERTVGYGSDSDGIVRFRPVYVVAASVSYEFGNWESGLRRVRGREREGGRKRLREKKMGEKAINKKKKGNKNY